MGAESKKHHYVPQSMLKRFAIDADNTRIHVFDKYSGRDYPSSIRDAGCENHFNRIELDGELINFEKLFDNIDANVPPVIDRILRNASVRGLTPKHMNDLAAGVASQLLRTKMMRTMQQALTEGLRESIEKAGIDLSRVDGLEMPTENEAKLLATSMLLDELPSLTACLLGKRLLMIENVGPLPFWISDNPVVYGNVFPCGDLGLYSLGVEFVIPISPRFTTLLAEPDRVSTQLIVTTKVGYDFGVSFGQSSVGEGQPDRPMGSRSRCKGG